jgi:hypothetical protein
MVLTIRIIASTSDARLIRRKKTPKRIRMLESILEPVLSVSIKKSAIRNANKPKLIGLNFKMPQAATK